MKDRKERRDNEKVGFVCLLFVSDEEFSCALGEAILIHLKAAAPSSHACMHGWCVPMVHDAQSDLAFWALTNFDAQNPRLSCGAHTVPTNLFKAQGYLAEFDRRCYRSKDHSRKCESPLSLLLKASTDAL